jgi:hypothetical protein
MRTALLGLLFGLVLPPVAQPAPTATALAEIDYLLAYVGTSGCEFYRNGTWYEPLKAQDHLRYKYEWLMTHGQIESTEDFIEKAATKSSLSGRTYKLRCGTGSEQATGQWFRQLLARYRARSSSGALGVDTHCGRADSRLHCALPNRVGIDQRIESRLAGTCAVWRPAGAFRLATYEGCTPLIAFEKEIDHEND